MTFNHFIPSQVPDWPRPWRYVYFILSSLKFKTFSAWRREGEPNPFVRRIFRERQTSSQEMADIFAMTKDEIADFQTVHHKKDYLARVRRTARRVRKARPFPSALGRRQPRR